MGFDEIEGSDETYESYEDSMYKFQEMGFERNTAETLIINSHSKSYARKLMKKAFLRYKDILGAKDFDDLVDTSLGTFISDGIEYDTWEESPENASLESLIDTFEIVEVHIALIETRNVDPYDVILSLKELFTPFESLYSYNRLSDAKSNLVNAFVAGWCREHKKDPTLIDLPADWQYEIAMNGSDNVDMDELFRR